MGYDTRKRIESKGHKSDKKERAWHFRASNNGKNWGYMKKKSGGGWGGSQSLAQERKEDNEKGNCPTGTRVSRFPTGGKKTRETGGVRPPEKAPPQQV